LGQEILIQATALKFVEGKEEGEKVPDMGGGVTTELTQQTVPVAKGVLTFAGSVKHSKPTMLPSPGTQWEIAPNEVSPKNDGEKWFTVTATVRKRKRGGSHVQRR